MDRSPVKKWEHDTNGKEGWQNSHALADTCKFGVLIGRSPAMLQVFEQIRRVAPHFRMALVTGATGSGKELVARTLHELSMSGKGPFVACNCAAVVEALFESQLFGHIKGAFTGAVSDQAGFFEHAHGGTLLLDEIGDMSLATQAKLLRVLQDQQVQRVGSPAARKLDVRLIAATNRNLRGMIELKQFREDLYYRLSTVEIELPTLSERMEDLPVLVNYFLKQISVQYRLPVLKFTRRAQALLVGYSWPGNIRELENVLKSACMLTQDGIISVESLPRYLQDQEFGKHPEKHVFQCGELVPLAEMERRYVQTIFGRMKYNKARAAQVLGISRPKLYRLLRHETSATVRDLRA
jgi:transcriptional regulator with PAS, ATPase and Fis domain